MSHRKTQLRFLKFFKYFFLFQHKLEQSYTGLEKEEKISLQLEDNDKTASTMNHCTNTTDSYSISSSFFRTPNIQTKQKRLTHCYVKVTNPAPRSVNQSPAASLYGHQGARCTRVMTSPHQGAQFVHQRRLTHRGVRLDT